MKKMSGGGRRFVCITAVLAILVVAGLLIWQGKSRRSSTGEQALSAELETVGIWYSSETEERFLFFRNGQYTSSDFLAGGSFQIGRDGQLILIDNYRDVRHLEVIVESGHIVALKLVEHWITTTFTPDKPPSHTDGPRELPADIRAMYLATVTQLVCEASWTNESGDSVSFTPTHMAGSSEELSPEYLISIEKASCDSSGTYTATIAIGEENYSLKITPVDDGTEAGYSLAVFNYEKRIFRGTIDGAFVIEQPG